MRSKMLAACVGGAAITAVFCFTPALVVLLGAVGLSAWLGWLDRVLLPLLGLFVLLAAYAAVSNRGAGRESSR